MLRASKLLLMKMPLAYSIVPMAPSQTRTRSFRASRKDCKPCVQPFALECIGIYQQIRLRDHVEADRANALADGIGELVVVAEQVQTRLHRRQHIVERRLTRIDAASRRIEGTRRLVREEQLDVLEALQGDHFVAHEMPPLVV